MSSGSTSPTIRIDSSAAISTVSISRVDFAAREYLIGLPASIGELLRQLLGPLAAAGGQMLQHGFALPGGRRRIGAAALAAAAIAWSSTSCVGQRDARGHFARVLVGDFQIGVRLLRPIGQVVGYIS